MKAMVRRTCGPPHILRLEEGSKPSPGEDEVLLRVHAAAANAGYWHLMRGIPFPFRFVAGLRVPTTRSSAPISPQSPTDVD